MTYIALLTESLASRKGGRVSASQPSTDVFIVGGGPAGLAAAIAARQKGFDVIVADGATAPIEKPCGEGLMPETLSALRDLGVELHPTDGYKFSSIHFLQPNAQVLADVPQGPGIGLRRPLLHQRLVDRAEQCGVQLLWKTPVSGLHADGVQLASGKICARWIIGADGQGSRVRRWSTLEASRRCDRRYATRRHYRVQPWSRHVEVYWGPHSQAYVTPIGAEEICAVVMSEHAQHSSFDSALQALPALREHLAGRELSTRERGAVTLMRSLRHVQRGNVALLGDASGSIDAITGEGLRLSFRQAFALADAMSAGDLAPYEQTHRRLARHPMLMGDLLLWLGRHPRLRSRVVRALQSKQDLFARLLATHVGAANSADLLSAGALLGWRLLFV
jgi:flavin-dependent dehydrogenase